MVLLGGVRARTPEPLFMCPVRSVRPGESPGESPPQAPFSPAPPEKRHRPPMSAVSPTPPSPSRRTGARVKSPELLLAESGADLEGHGLRRTMGLFQLVCFGVGAIVGTGIFVGLSDSVAEAGPAVVVSFVLAAITCVFTAFSFAELGSAIPVSGSAVAVGWSQYLNELLDSLTGHQLPAALSAGPGDGGVVNLPAVIVILL